MTSRMTIVVSRLGLWLRERQEKEVASGRKCRMELPSHVANRSRYATPITLKRMRHRPWLMLIYSLPARPSTQRVFVWRKLKTAGVLYLQHSVCLLPDDPSSRKVFNVLRNDIVERKGEARISSIVFQVTEEESEIVSRFQLQADEEYQEFLGRCRDFHKELEMERKKEHFSFAEIEENEFELDKLARWLPKIEARDFFSAKLGPKARTALKARTADFNRYCKEVTGREVPLVSKKTVSITSNEQQ